MARKPDIFDEIILYLKENQNADFSLTEETRNALFSAPPQKTIPVQQTAMPTSPAPAPAVSMPNMPPPVIPVPVATPAAAPAPQLRPFADVSNMDWDTLRQTAMQCGGCELCKTRNSVVFGEGPLNARLMFIGEGPGADEDAQGRPFVGKAGELLTRMITAMGFDRWNEVYIANIVKCRPPGNRVPEPDEAAACIGYLKQQIRIVQPEVIVLLGGTALSFLLREKASISKMRGNWIDFEGIPVMPTFHPAYLLRQESAKREAWNDLQKVMKALGVSRHPGSGTRA